MLYYVCQYVYLYIHYTDNFELLWGCKLISALLFRPSCKSKQKLHALPITKLFYYFSTHTIKSIFVSPDSILKVATGYFRRQSWHRFKSRIRKEGKAHKIWTACILHTTWDPQQYIGGHEWRHSCKSPWHVPQRWWVDILLIKF